MKEDESFSPEYTGHEGTDSTVPEIESVGKEIEDSIRENYDISKPKRVVIKAKIIHDKS